MKRSLNKTAGLGAGYRRISHQCIYLLSSMQCILYILVVHSKSGIREDAASTYQCYVLLLLPAVNYFPVEEGVVYLYLVINSQHVSSVLYGGKSAQNPCRGRDVLLLLPPYTADLLRKYFKYGNCSSRDPRNDCSRSGKQFICEYLELRSLKE